MLQLHKWALWQACALKPSCFSMKSVQLPFLCDPFYFMMLNTSHCLLLQWPILWFCRDDLMVRCPHRNPWVWGCFVPLQTPGGKGGSFCTFAFRQRTHLHTSPAWLRCCTRAETTPVPAQLWLGAHRAALIKPQPESLLFCHIQQLTSNKTLGCRCRICCAGLCLTFGF